MRTVPELIEVVESVIRKGKPLQAHDLSKEDYENYQKLKLQIEQEKQLDSRTLKINTGLKDKLYASIFGMEPSKSRFSLMQRNIIEIIKQGAIAELLRGIGANKSAYEISKSVYSKSKKYLYTKGILSASRKLFQFEADRGNLKKAAGYYQDCILALQLSENEIKAEWYASELRNHFTQTKAISESLRQRAEDYFQELNLIDDALTTRTFYRNFFTVGIIHFESSFEFYDLCKFLEKNINLFEEHHSEDRNTILMLRLYHINYLLRIKNVNKAETELDIGFTYCAPKSARWFRLKELQMQFFLRSGQYQACMDIYEALKAEPRFKRLSKEVRNRNELLWLYAIISKALSVGKREGRLLVKEVRLGRFLNSIPEFFVDKKGMNVSIIIVQLLYFIILEDHDRLDDRFDAIEKYLTRYMRNDPLYRSNCFVKMLLQVPKQSFHPIAVQRHADRYLNNLNSLNFLESQHPNEIELMEYNMLWELVVEFLKSK